MPCLSDDDIVGWIEGLLDEGARERCLMHITTCETCRAVVGGAASLCLEGGDPEPGALRTGDAVGDYTLVERVGKGGTSDVWSASPRGGGALVAVKVLRLADPDLTRRTLREARIVSAISHPNIVPINACFALGEASVALVMDLLVGRSLLGRLREGPLSLPEALATLVPIADALSRAHALGVVHRDLKPANIFLSSAKGGVTPLLLDFGFAKLTLGLGPTAATSQLTAKRTLIGTPQYMAPEQLYGEDNIDTRADVFAFGALIYECLSGQRPIVGTSLGELLRNHAMGEIVPIASRVPGLPPALARLIDACLAKRREDRPSSLAPFVAFGPLGMR